MRRDFFTVVLGIGLGQLILLISTPILARMYTPEQFGQYAVLLALSGVVATGAALRLDVAIPALIDSEVNQVSAIAYILPVLVVSVFCLVVPFDGLDIFPSLKGISNVSVGSLWFVACLQGMTAVSLAYCTRYGLFRTSALVKIIQPTFFVLTALTLSNNGLIYGLITGWAIAAVIGYYSMRRLEWIAGWKKFLITLSKKREYPLISLPVALLDTFTLSLPLFIIASIYGDSSAGNYSQIQRLAASPLLLSGVAISQVFYKHGGDLSRQNQSVAPLMWNTVMKLLGLGALLLFFAWLTAEPVFRLFLGKSWRIDTYFVVMVLLPVVFRMAVSPVSSVFLICNRIALGGKWQLIYFLWTFPVLYFASRYTEFDTFLAIFAISEFVMYLLYLMFAKIAVSHPLKKVMVT